MNRTDTAQCYALVCAAYETEPNELNIEAWHLLMRDLDGPLAIEATRRLCRRDSPFPPRPGEILAEAKRIRGEEPPGVDAAVGLYFADREDMHPLVQRAAGKCFFDRHKTDYERARWEFRNAYEAILYEAEDEARQPSRQALGIEPARTHHARALEAAERDRPTVTYEMADDPWLPPAKTDPPSASEGKAAFLRMREQMRARAGELQSADDGAGGAP